jgi:hypothetical protein
MSTAVKSKLAKSGAIDSAMLGRIAQEGYGPGAWHGPDLKAALSDVTPELAFWRPATGRHNIAEIAMHHAFFARSVRGQLSSRALEPFAIEGEEWFSLSKDKPLGWKEITKVVDTEQSRLADAIRDLGSGKSAPQGDVEPFSLVLGITCHAIYHAGQIQLIKRLKAER